MTRPEDDADKARLLGRPIARFMARWRDVIRRRPWLDVLYRVLITALGALIVIIGLILVPLPGPGWLIVFIGLTVLGSEYHWARRLLGWLRKTLARFWERWRAWRTSRAERTRQSAAAGPAFGSRLGQPAQARQTGQTGQTGQTEKA